MDRNQPTGSTVRKSETTNDGNAIITGLRYLKTLDANRYATKKTIAQGLLDVALLTANASQLKYVLQVGKQHEFYTLMLSLIIVSIVLQGVQAIFCLVLGTTLDINKEKDQDNANKANNIVLIINVLIVGVNVILSAFQIKYDEDNAEVNEDPESKVY